MGLKTAIEYIQNIGFDTIGAIEEELTKRAFDGLMKIPHINIQEVTTRKSIAELSALQLTEFIRMMSAVFLTLTVLQSVQDTIAHSL